MKERKPKDGITFNPLELYDRAVFAYDLLDPKMFIRLGPERQEEVLKACGVDPNNPDAYNLATKRAGEQLEAIRKKVFSWEKSS
jgi:hypothetical protein